MNSTAESNKDSRFQQAIQAPGVKFGLISGLVYVASDFILYSLGIDWFLGFSRSIPFVLMLAFGLVAGFAERRENGGFIIFGRAVMVVGTVFILTEAFFNIGQFVLYNVVEPEFHLRVKEKTIESTELAMSFYQKVLPNNEQGYIDALNTVKKADYRITFYGSLQRFVVWSIFDFLFALLLAIIIRKEPKNREPIKS